MKYLNGMKPESLKILHKLERVLKLKVAQNKCFASPFYGKIKKKGCFIC